MSAYARAADQVVRADALLAAAREQRDAARRALIAATPSEPDAAVRMAQHRAAGVRTSKHDREAAHAAQTYMNEGTDR